MLRPIMLAAATLLMLAAASPPADQHLCHQAAYVREPADRPWQLRLSGRVPSLPGCYVVVHDAENHLLLKRHIPGGDYSPGQPLLIDMPADGRSGDYRILIVGFQDDILGLNLPLTDLPLEVYGRTQFATRSKALRFRVPPGQQTMTFWSHAGGLRIWQDDTLLLDTQAQGQVDKYRRLAVANVKPDVNYRIEPYGSFYFGAEEGLFVTFDLQRWFVPDARLEEVKWWQLQER